MLNSSGILEIGALKSCFSERAHTALKAWQVYTRHSKPGVGTLGMKEAQPGSQAGVTDSPVLAASPVPPTQPWVWCWVTLCLVSACRWTEPKDPKAGYLELKGLRPEVSPMYLYSTVRASSGDSG